MPNNNTKRNLIKFNPGDYAWYYRQIVFKGEYIKLKLLLVSYVPTYHAWLCWLPKELRKRFISWANTPYIIFLEREIVSHIIEIKKLDFRF